LAASPDYLAIGQFALQLATAGAVCFLAFWRRAEKDGEGKQGVSALVGRVVALEARAEKSEERHGEQDRLSAVLERGLQDHERGCEKRDAEIKQAIAKVEQRIDDVGERLGQRIDNAVGNLQAQITSVAKGEAGEFVAVLPKARVRRPT
jgi:hypothetical protein